MLLSPTKLEYAEEMERLLSVDSVSPLEYKTFPVLKSERVNENFKSVASWLVVASLVIDIPLVEKEVETERV